MKVISVCIFVVSLVIQSFILINLWLVGLRLSVSCAGSIGWDEWISCMHGVSHLHVIAPEIAVGSWLIAGAAALAARSLPPYTGRRSSRAWSCRRLGLEGVVMSASDLWRWPVPSLTFFAIAGVICWRFRRYQKWNKEQQEFQFPFDGQCLGMSGSGLGLRLGWRSWLSCFRCLSMFGEPRLLAIVPIRATAG
jgi:hypothetical protein